MHRRRLIACLAGALFVASIYAANWLVRHIGPIRVWPTDLLAPAGVYVVGLAFLLRDTVQRLAGQIPALALVAAGCGLSALVSPALAGASAAAFAASELVGLALFRLARGNSAGPAGLSAAVAASSAAAAALDSFVFLSLAPHLSLAFFNGQFVAKLSVSLLALPFVLAVRRALPDRPPVAVASEA